MNVYKENLLHFSNYFGYKISYLKLDFLIQIYNWTCLPYDRSNNLFLGFYMKGKKWSKQVPWKKHLKPLNLEWRRAFYKAQLFHRVLEINWRPQKWASWQEDVTCLKLLSAYLLKWQKGDEKITRGRNTKFVAKGSIQINTIGQ